MIFPESPPIPAMKIRSTSVYSHLVFDSREFISRVWAVLGSDFLHTLKKFLFLVFNCEGEHFFQGKIIEASLVLDVFTLEIQDLLATFPSADFRTQKKILIYFFDNDKFLSTPCKEISELIFEACEWCIKNK